MKENKYRDEIMGLIETASNKFGSSATLNPGKFAKLDSLCEYVYNIVPDFRVEFFDVSVNTDTKQFTIEFVCNEIIVRGIPTHDFFKLIQLVDSFSFHKEAPDKMRTIMNIDSMWE